MEIKEILGLTIEDIEWMKRYFIERLIIINPAIDELNGNPKN